MLKLIGVSGSLRRASFNTALLRAAKAAVAPQAELEVRTLHGIPLYDGDIEDTTGPPQAVTALKQAIVDADGLLLVTPEYNHGVPGVFKNGIDWLTRPSGEAARLFRGKPTALIGASPGPFGTTLSQAAWLPILTTLGCLLWSEKHLMVSRANQAFAADGTLNDATIKTQLEQYMQGFAAFVQRQVRR